MPAKTPIDEMVRTFVTRRMFELLANALNSCATGIVVVLFVSVVVVVVYERRQ